MVELWLLATDNLKDIKFPFLKENKKVIDFLNTKYKILWNFVDCRNSLHIKWLKWCGFKFINKQKRGVLNNLYIGYKELIIGPSNSFNDWKC